MLRRPTPPQENSYARPVASGSSIAAAEFETRDVDATMATDGGAAYVNHADHDGRVG
jgi:hypothetical protein